MSEVRPQFTIAAGPGRVRALFEGHEVADSARALVLSEAGQEPVVYFPREDVQMSVLEANDHVTSGPWGPATWFTIMRDAKIVEDVAWSYERPDDDANVISDYIAFAPQHVDLETDGTVQPIRHVPPMDPPYTE